jgi:uncharacterized protein YmfQ (DUF2313 family)
MGSYSFPPGADRHVRRSGEDYLQPFLALLPQGQAWPKAPDSTLTLTAKGLTYIWGFADARAADLLERESDPRQTIELLPDWERAWGLPDECLAEPISIADRQKMLVMWMTMLGAQSREFFSYACSLIGYTIAAEDIREWSPWMVGVSPVGDTRGLSGWQDVDGVGPYTGTSNTMMTVASGPMTFAVNQTGLPYVIGDQLRLTSQDAHPDDIYIWMQGPVTAFDGTNVTLNVDHISDTIGDSANWRVEKASVLHRWEIGAPEMRFYWSVRVQGVRLTWFRCGWQGSQCGVDPHLRIALATDLECLLQRWKPAHTEVKFDYSGMPTPDPMAGTP